MPKLTSTFLTFVIATGILAAHNAAHAQVAAPAMRNLSEMSGFTSLQAAVGGPLRPRSAAAATPVNLSFGRSPGGTRAAMSEATNLLTKTGVSAEMAGRLTNSGYFSSAAKKYGVSLGLVNINGDLSDALAAYLSVCYGAIKNVPISAPQASGIQVLARSHLLQRLQGKAIDNQASAEALNVQTGLAVLVTEQRKAIVSANTELSIYCTEGTRKLGFDVDQFNLGK